MRESRSARDPDDLPAAEGRVFVVTGGNAGIGYFISEQLAATGATVVIASRNETKASAAVQAITARVPGAVLRWHPLDLGDLAQARRSGERLRELGRVDGLVLNAAALSQRSRRETPDGHELVFGTNFFGNAQFLAAALPALLDVRTARVVTMGSFIQRIARLDPDDLEPHEKRYRGLRSYARSKQAQMLFALELDRRLRVAGSGAVSLMAHPGGALDGLTPDRPPAFTIPARERRRAVLQRLFVQGKDRAAWPAVRALLDPDAKGGELWGPGSATGSRPPRREPLRGALRNGALAAKLWDRTQQLLGLDWPW